MGAFSVDIKISKYIPPQARQAGDYKMTTVSALAGTGSVFSMFPASLLTELGIVAHREQTFVNGVIHDMGTALIAIGNGQAPCPVIFGPEGRFVLGKLALENLFLEIDDAGKSLIPKEYSLLVSVLPDDDDDEAIRPAPALMEAK